MSRRIMSTWLYQFWLFSFRTAKYWGRGPRNWTANSLGFSTHHELASIPSPNTPSMIAHSPEDAMDYQGTMKPIPKPSSLCRWSIHMFQDHYEEIPSPPPEQRNLDPHEEES